jgi:hypothetical protein
MGRGTARTVKIQFVIGNYRERQIRRNLEAKAPADAYHAVTYFRHRHRRFSRGTVCAGHLVFEPEGRGGKEGRLNFFRSGRTNPVEEGTEYSFQAEAWNRPPHSIQHPWQETERSNRSAAFAGARRGRGVGLQPSLFTRLAAVEAELAAMKDRLAELKVNQDELRQDRDEWRWRAERLLADLQRGAWWRWWNRAAAALDVVRARLRGLLADVQNKLSEMKANRDGLLQGGRQWRSRAERTLID